jgi:hypothetical protein
MSEHEQLAALCVRLGAAPAAAETMAAQLLKRAGQLAAARGITREEALAQLVARVIEARTGGGTAPPAGG